MRRLALACALLIPMLAATATLAQQSAQNPSVNLVNQARVPIRELYFTPAGDANWGRNRLQGASIAPGTSYPVRRRIDGNCVFDIRVVFANGRIEDRRNINTCFIDDIAFGAAPAAAGVKSGANDPSFRLINRGSQAITEAFATPAGMGNWGQNRLQPAGQLPPETDRVVRIPSQGNCFFDLRVVFADHTAKERHRVNLCRLSDLPVP